MQIRKNVNPRIATNCFFLTDNGVIDHNFQQVGISPLLDIRIGTQHVVLHQLYQPKPYDTVEDLPADMFTIIFKARGSIRVDTTVTDDELRKIIADDSRDDYRFGCRITEPDIFLKVPKNFQTMYHDTEIIKNKRIIIRTHAHFSIALLPEISDIIHHNLLRLIGVDYHNYPSVPADNTVMDDGFDFSALGDGETTFTLEDQ